LSTPLVGPDGQEYVFDGDETALEGLRAKGFHAPGEDMRTPVEAGIDYFKTGTQAVVRGLTGGLSDAAFDKQTRREAKRLAEENPTTALVGELGGMLLSPGSAVGSAVTKGIGATTRLGRVGANIAGGGVSGLLFGAGKTVSDAALGDVELTAEKLVAGTGLGGLLGLAGGGIGGVVEEGARAAVPLLSSLAKRATSVLDDIANDAAIRSTRAQQSVINKLGDDKFAAVAGALRDRGHLKLTPEAMAESVAKDREALGKVLGRFLDDAEAAGSKPDLMKMIQRLDDFEAGLNPLERQSIANEVAKARKAVAELGASGNDGFRALDEVKRTVQDKAKFSRGPIPDDDVVFGLKRKLAGAFRDELDQQLLPALGSDAAKVFTESKAVYGALKDAERLTASGLGRPGGFGYLGLKDLAAAAAASSAHPMGLAAAVGSKVIREHGQAIVARIADKLAKEPALKAVAKSFAASLPQTAPQLGQYGATLMQEAAQSPERALALHMAQAQLDPSYAATAQLAGLTPETPEEQPHVVARAQTLAEAGAAAAAQDAMIAKGIDRVARGGGSSSPSALKSQDFGAMRMRRDSAAGYDKRVDEVRELATNPQALVDRIAANMGPLGQTAPGVAAALTNTAYRAVQYLAQQAEVPPKAGPLAPEWDAPEADRQSFAEKLEVVQDPMSVLQAASAGMLTEEQMGALRAVYPRLAQQMADAALERMATATGPVPYQQRLMLGMLSGVDPDGSLSPEAVAANQATIFAAKQAADAPDAPQDAGDVSLATRTALPGQRREVRNER